MKERTVAGVGGKDKVTKANLHSNVPVIIGKQRRDGNWNIYEKCRKSTTKAKSLWTETEVISEQGTVELAELNMRGVFDHPKPIGLIEKCLRIGTADDDLVLDFFAGSCTTAHAVMRLNHTDGGSRRYIMVQLPEPCGNDTVASKEGFRTIADVGRERIRRAARAIAETEQKELKLHATKAIDRGFKTFKLDRSNFRIWDGGTATKGNLEQQIEMHVEHLSSSSSSTDILFELLLKAGFPLTTKVKVVEMAGKQVVSVQEGALLICLEKEITPELIDALADANPMQVICLDEGFKGNDQLKANAVQTFKARAQAEESEIVFRTV